MAGLIHSGVGVARSHPLGCRCCQASSTGDCVLPDQHSWWMFPSSTRQPLHPLKPPSSTCLPSISSIHPVLLPECLHPPVANPSSTFSQRSQIDVITKSFNILKKKDTKVFYIILSPFLAASLYQNHGNGTRRLESIKSRIPSALLPDLLGVNTLTGPLNMSDLF